MLQIVPGKLVANISENQLFCIHGNVIEMLRALLGYIPLGEELQKGKIGCKDIITDMNINLTLIQSIELI